MKQTQPRLVEIKGLREGLRIILHPEPPLEEVRAALIAHLDKFGEAFAGTGVFLDVGARALGDDDLRQLQRLLERRYGLELRRVLSTSEHTRQFAEILQLSAVPTLQSSQAQAEAEGDQEWAPEFARVVRQTVRAGQVERFYEGSILVMGDVNPGGEIIASGDIVVLGTMRGIAWAGCLGDLSAVVIAQQLLPTQLRIGTLWTRPDDGEMSLRRRPQSTAIEIARIIEDRIVVQEYHGL